MGSIKYGSIEKHLKPLSPTQIPTQVKNKKGQLFD